MKIAHLAIKVHDLEAAGEFHEKVFGFRDVRQGPNRLKSRGLKVISNPGVIPLKFKVPGGGVAEVAPRQHFKID
jgi:catechol 2,3-dioxygenase-like lactoylglutathione lyase family enzyme